MSEPERRPLSDPAVQRALGKRGNKYHARRTEVDGIVFDSAREARWFQELQLREKAGEIKHLVRQVTFVLSVAGVHVGDYVADATYWELTTCGEWGYVVADYKGFKTAAYRLKKKLMQAIHRIEIREV